MPHPRYRHSNKRGYRARGKCWNCCMDRGDPRHKVDATGKCLAAPRDGSKALCFECWEQGHRKESCPSKKCFLCLQPGHVWKKCPFKNKSCPKCSKLFKSEHHMRVCLKKQWEDGERQREKTSSEYIHDMNMAHEIWNRVIPSNLGTTWQTWAPQYETPRGKPHWDPRYGPQHFRPTHGHGFIPALAPPDAYYHPQYDGNIYWNEGANDGGYVEPERSPMMEGLAGADLPGLSITESRIGYQDHQYLPSTIGRPDAYGRPERGTVVSPPPGFDIGTQNKLFLEMSRSRSSGSTQQSPESSEPLEPPMNRRSSSALSGSNSFIPQLAECE